MFVNMSVKKEKYTDMSEKYKALSFSIILDQTWRIVNNKKGGSDMIYDQNGEHIKSTCQQRSVTLATNV